MMSGTNRAADALYALDAGCDREAWHKIGRAGLAAGLPIEVIDAWSATGSNYKNTQDVLSSFRNIKPDGGTGPGTLFMLAREAGWTERKPQRQAPPKALTRLLEPPRKPAPGMSPSEVWERCKPATNKHGYIDSKRAAGVPLDNLKVVPAGDPLRIANESMAGALVVPITRRNGTLSSLQFVTVGATAERLKAQRKNSKLNLAGCPVDGFFTVGVLEPGGVAYIVEGIGQAWACWQATGAAAVVCFGWGRMRAVAAELRQHDATARLVLVPDVGKESFAEKIARDVGAAVAVMPEGWEQNDDVNDLAQREGLDVLEMVLFSAKEPLKPESRYKLLGSADLATLPPLTWRVRGVLPAVGLAALYGPSASGKSFLGFDMAAAIAEGRRWFDLRIEAAPVVYVALEGEAGFKLRAQAWEAHTGRALPAAMKMVMQPFKLTEPQDVNDLAAVVPSGAVVIVDTLNRAAPTADENGSADMGKILEAAKELQSRVGGLVTLIHHSGKDATKGLRGHSSLIAAMDAAIEVSRDGDRREWKVAKSKDGADGDAHPFRLEIETLGTDAYGDPITSCTVRVDGSDNDVKRVKVPQGGNQGLVYSAIRAMFKDGTCGKPGAPPLRPCIELEAAITRGASSLTCETHRRATRAREAITGLVTRGVLGLNEGWLWTAN